MPLSARPGFEPPRSLPSAPYLTPMKLTPRDKSTTRLVFPRDVRGIKGEGFLAAIEDDNERLEELIKQGLDPNETCFDNESLLHAAVSHDSLNSLNVLISNGAKVNCVTEYFNEPPIHISIQNGSIDSFLALIDAGADLELKNIEGESCIFIAVKSGKLQIVKSLLKKNVKINILNKNGLSPFQIAVMLHEIVIAKELSSNGADVSIGDDNSYRIALEANEIEICDFIRAANPELARSAFHVAQSIIIPGTTPLLPPQAFVHIKMKNSLGLRKLLLTRYELNKPDPKEGLALISAIESGSLDCVKVLVNSGSNIDIIDKETPLCCSIRLQRHEITKYLIAAGADLSLSNNEGDNPLFSAIRVQNLTLIKELISKGVSLNITNINNMSPLYMAVGLKQIEIVKELLNAGADPNSSGLSPLKLAQDIKASQIINLLINSGAKTQIKRAARKTRQQQAIFSLSSPIQNSDSIIETEDGRCSICKSKTLLLKLIPCGHNVTCKKCIGTFMDKNNQCPICKLGFYATASSN